jgi:16S rRNA G527 N7-methylase RsmG
MRHGEKKLKLKSEREREKQEIHYQEKSIKMNSTRNLCNITSTNDTLHKLFSTTYREFYLHFILNIIPSASFVRISIEMSYKELLYGCSIIC